MVKQGIVGGSARIPGRGGQAKKGPAGAPGRAFIEGRHLLLGPPLLRPGEGTCHGWVRLRRKSAQTLTTALDPPARQVILYMWLGITGVGRNHSAVADFVQRNISLASNRCQRKKGRRIWCSEGTVPRNLWTTGTRSTGRLAANRRILLPGIIWTGSGGYP